MKNPAAEDTAHSHAEQGASRERKKFSTFAAMRAVFASTTLSSSQRLVALAIINHADSNGTAFPGRARLARETALSRRAITDALNALAKAGVIRWTSRKTSVGDQDTNLYTIVVSERDAVGQQAPYRPAHADTELGQEVPDSRAMDAIDVGHRLPQGRAAGAHKQINQQESREVCAGREEASSSRSTTGGSRSDQQEDLSENQRLAWAILEQVHKDLRIKHYGTGGLRERVSTQNKVEIVDLLLETATYAIQAWREIHPNGWTFDKAYRRVVEEILGRWFTEYAGNDDYLVQKKHPLFVLRHDLTELEADWREGWDEYVDGEKARTAAGKPGGMAGTAAGAGRR